MRRTLIVLLCLCFIPYVVQASAFLSAQDLQSVQPEYESFLEALADVLEQRGLLAPGQRAEWIEYQLGDYLQNGGYGTIAVMYNPDLLSVAEPDMMLLRVTAELSAGALRVETLRAFTPNASTIPGLPLEATVSTQEGVPVECRFRWYASSGQLLIWDAPSNAIMGAGASLISEGQPVYWLDSPVGAGRETLRLELLAVDSDAVLGEYAIQVQSDGQRWKVMEE